MGRPDASPATPTAWYAPLKRQRRRQPALDGSQQGVGWPLGKHDDDRQARAIGLSIGKDSPVLECKEHLGRAVGRPAPSIARIGALVLLTHETGGAIDAEH